MAFIQKYQQLNSKTIKELCFKHYAKMIAIKPGGCKIIHIVGDRYDVPDDQSLKADERKRRTGSKKLQEYVLSSNLEIPEWSQLIHNHKNKAHLLNFLSETISDNSEEVIPNNLVIIFVGTFEYKGMTMLFRKYDKKRLVELFCSDHEEADTRIIAHMIYAANTFGQSSLIIHATDTDIIVM